MILSFLYSFVLWAHPIHLSVTEITYSEKDNALQITSRIFLDDLELSIREQVQQPELDILEPSTKTTTEALIKHYVLSKMSVKLDGKTQSLNFLGFERDDPAIVCYIEIPKIKKFKKIEIHNEIIMETHSDQSNLVHVMYKGPVKSLRLLRDKPSDIITFDPK